MKLYTELDIYQAIADARYYQEKIMPSKKIVQKLRPIELPSDEEIERFTDTMFYGEKKYFAKVGALWMKNEILNQNNK